MFTDNGRNSYQRTEDGDEAEAAEGNGAAPSPPAAAQLLERQPLRRSLAADEEMQMSPPMKGRIQGARTGRSHGNG